LYHYDEPFREIQASEKHIIVLDSTGVFWLLSFQHFFNPKESIQLQNKTKFFEGTRDDTCFFEYPFVSFANPYKPITLMLIDVQTRKDLFKENKIQIPEVCYPRLINREYFAVECETYDETAEFWFFQLSNLTKTPFKIQVPEISRCYVGRNMCFIVPDESTKSTTIDCYFFDSGKKNTISVPSLSVYSINKLFVFSQSRNNLTEFYRWNSNYTNLTFMKTTQDSCDHYYIDCFYQSLPFIAFCSYLTQDGFKRIRIYSNKDGKEVAEIPLPKNYDYLVGDRKSRIYYRLEENNEFYLHIIDFAD